MSSAAPRPFIHVVAGVLMDGAERVLIAQRPAGKHLAGGWEFPGGKLEPGEDRRVGLARELHEELGITLLGTLRPLSRLRHAYPSRDVLLDVWVVRQYDGEPRGLDGQALRWCTQEELDEVELLPADGPIVRALRLPERLRQPASPLYAISETAPGPRSTECQGVANEGPLRGVLCTDLNDAVAAVQCGADFLVLRNTLERGRLADVCASVPVPVFARGIALDEAWMLGASGTNEL